MKRRIFGLFASLLTIAAVTVPAFPVKAEEEEAEGMWVLTQTLTWSDEGYEIGSRDDDNYKTAYGNQTFPYSHCYYVDAMEPDPGSDYGNKYSYFWLETEIGCAGDDYGFMPETIDPGSLLSIELTARYAYTDNALNIDETSYATVSLCDPATPMTGFLDSDTPMVMVNSINEDINIPQASITFDFTAGTEVGEEKVISFRSTGNETRYVYKWETEEVPEDLAELGTWTLVEQYLHTPSEWQYDAPDYLTKIFYSGSETSYLIKVTHDKKIDALPDDPNSTFVVTFSAPPPNSFTAGEHIKMDVSLAITGSSYEFWSAGVDYTNDQNVFYPYRGTYVDENVYGVAQFENMIIRDGGIVNSATDGIQTAHIIAPVPEHPEKTAFCGIRYYAMARLGNQDMPTMMYTDYIYEWTGDPEAVAAYIKENGEGEEGEEATEPLPTGEDIVVTKKASKEKGEDKEGIPAGAIAGIVAGAAAVAGGGAAAANAAKKKKGKNNDKNKDKDKDKQQSKSTFEMRIHKEFGDTIIVDDELPVYARIVEITENGVEKDRTDLTARIRISSPDYLSVKHEQISGNYKAALVYAPKDKSENIPDTAQIVFTLAGPTGSFTEKVIFNIENPEIEFYQSNLTLPAVHDKTEELEFTVRGVETITSVTAKMKTKTYDVEVVERKKGENGASYYAKITEKKKNKLEVAETEQHPMIITAKVIGSDKKPRIIEETFYIYRMGLGFVLSTTEIGCYLDKDGKPAVTKGYLKLLAWDKKNNKVVTATPNPSDFRCVHRRANENLEDLSDDTLKEIALLNNLAVGIVVKENAKVIPGKGLECEFSCNNKTLDPPQRLVSDLIIKGSYDGAEYETRKEFVRLSSQPRRKFANPNEEAKAIERDKQIEDGLRTILSAINRYGLEKQLHPMVTFINLMLDNYDKKYGYDEHKVERIQRAYLNVLNNMKGEAHAVVANQDELASTFLGKCSIVADYAQQCEDSIGLGKRILLGACTIGGSEAAFLTCKVYRNVRDAVMESDSDKSDFDTWRHAFFMGVKPVGEEYINGRIMKWAGGKLKSKYAKWKAGKIPDVKAANAASKTMNGTVDKTLTSKLNTVEGTRLKNAGEQSLKAANEAKEAVEKAVKGAKNIALSEADEAFERGVEIGRDKLYKMMAAEGDDFAKWAMSVQADKYAMSALKRMRGEAATELRARFNKVIMAKNNEAIRLTREAIAKQLGCSVDEIQIFKASSNTAAKLKSGLTTTFDLDVTYMQVKNGKVFNLSQNFTEPLHNQSCYKAFNGVPAPDAETAKAFAKGIDHTVVQSTSPENYRSKKVLDTIIDKAKQGDIITDAEAAKAGNVIEYKGADRLERCKDWLKKALLGETETVRQAALRAAQMEKAEGFRQIVKQADYLLSKDVIAMSRGSNTSISSNMRFAWETFRKVSEGQLTPDRAELLIKAKCGMDPEQVCKETGKLLAKINDKLCGSFEVPDALVAAKNGIKNMLDKKEET